MLAAVANARLTPQARVAAQARLPHPLEMQGPTPMYLDHCQKAAAMGNPVMELPMDWSARNAAGHHTPASGMPRELEWPMREAAGHQAEEVVATAQVALASNPKVGGEGLDQISQ